VRICVLLALSKRLDDRTARIATTLADAGHDVRVVLGPDRGAQSMAQRCHPRVTVTSWARPFDRWGLRTIGRCCAWVLSLAHAFMLRANVVHAIGYRTLRRGQLLTLGRATLVYDAPDGIDCNRRRRLERRRLGAAAGLIAGSPRLARELAQRRQGGGMPLVLRDTPERSPVMSTPLRERLVIDRRPLLLQSDPGTADAELAIAALRQVPAAHLLVLVPSERADDVRLAAERGRVASRVHVIGQIEERELASYAREVTAGLCLNAAPSGERLVPPPAAYHFLAGGARVIATDAIGCEELSEQTHLVRIVPSNDQGALAGAMADAVSATPEADDPEAWWWTREQAALVEFYGRLPALSTADPPKHSRLPAGGLRRVLRGVLGLRRRASRPATPRGLYHFTQGQRLRARHDFAGAADAFAQAVENAPSNTRYRLSLGGALRDLGRDEDAIEAYRQVIEPSEGEPSADSLTAAIALARLGARSDCRDVRDKLAASRNKTPESIATLAQLEASLGNLDKARSALEAIADSDDEVEPGVERIEMMVREQCGDLAAALQIARRLKQDSAISRLEPRIRVYADHFLPRPPVAPDWTGPKSDRRVMHLLETALPFSTSGYSYRTTSVLAAQRLAGLEPTAVTRLGFPANRGVIGHPPLEIVEGVVHHYLALPGVRYYTGIPIDQQLERNTEMLAPIVEQVRPAALHATSPHLNGLLGLSLREGFNIGLVYEARGFPEMTWACRPGGEQSEAYELRRRAETRCMREADAVITLSEVMKAQIVQRGVPDERVYVVPHMVDVDSFSPRDKDPELVREYGLEGKIVAGYISSLVDYEGVDVLLRGIAEAHRADRRVVGLIVGDGPAMPNLRELAADLGIEDVIRFTGRVPHSATIAHYSLIDIFVAPRQGWEVCRHVTPLKPFEAMAMGRCLLVSDIPALAETTNWGAHGRLFAVGDSDDLARRIVALARDPDLRAQLGKDARDFVVANHSTTLPRRVILDPINAARYGRPTTPDVAALQAEPASETTAATGIRR
jgi:glycosyltransferase involved in cell wall biosynthesis